MRYFLFLAILLSGCGSDGSHHAPPPIRLYSGPSSSPHTGTANVQTQAGAPTNVDWDLTNIVIAGAPSFTGIEAFTTTDGTISGTRSFTSSLNGGAESDTWTGNWSASSGTVTLVVDLTLVRQVSDGAGGFTQNTYNLTITFLCPQVSGPA